MNYDVIIIGSGAGGGTLAHKLANAGKKILILERGKFLPREKQNWDTVEVFQKDRYHAHETWLDKEGNEFHPGTGYWVGGNTKVYGAALLRLREKDFGLVNHKGGISPEWPIRYAELESYYTAAEALYHVHGKRGVDPTEPKMSQEYPHPPVSHEPRIQELHDQLVARGHKPFSVPLGVRLNEQDPLASQCVRCDTCDGFPCLVNAKSDADVTCIRPILKMPNVTLLTDARVLRIDTNSTGKEVTEVITDVSGKQESFRASLVVVSAGAINSAVLLLKSASDRHPRGLANSSDQVGRNFMKHLNGAILALSNKKNSTVFQKTMAVNDFYWGEEDYSYPMGHVQLLGKANKDMLAGDAPSFAPGRVLDEMAHHSIDWWLTAEDLPQADNRVTVKGDQVTLNYTENNLESFDRLMKRWIGILKQIDGESHIVPHSLYLRKKIPIAGVAHQVGTCRMGKSPSDSVVNSNCQTHDVDNLYVVDGSFFPSSAAVNPSLTIIANALRVGDHILSRLK